MNAPKVKYYDVVINGQKYALASKDGVNGSVYRVDEAGDTVPYGFKAGNLVVADGEVVAHEEVDDLDMREMGDE